MLTLNNFDYIYFYLILFHTLLIIICVSLFKRFILDKLKIFVKQNAVRVILLLIMQTFKHTVCHTEGFDLTDKVVLSTWLIVVGFSVYKSYKYYEFYQIKQKFLEIDKNLRLSDQIPRVPKFQIYKVDPEYAEGFETLCRRQVLEGEAPLRESNDILPKIVFPKENDYDHVYNDLSFYQWKYQQRYLNGVKLFSEISNNSTFTKDYATYEYVWVNS